jgi:hypothetical protein
MTFYKVQGRFLLLNLSRCAESVKNVVRIFYTTDNEINNQDYFTVTVVTRFFVMLLKMRLKEKYIPKKFPNFD